MGQQNLIPVQPSNSNNGASQPAPHPPATGHIQPSSSIPTQASSMHPVVLLPPSGSLQQPQSAPVVTVPIHGAPPGLIPQHPHPPIALQQQQQPVIQGQSSGAFGDATITAPVQSLPSTQILQQQQQQHAAQSSNVVGQPIGVQSISSIQQAEVVLQQQPVQQAMPTIQPHVQQSGPHLIQPSQQQQQPTLVQQTVPSLAAFGNANNPNISTLPTAVMSIASSMQPSVQLTMAAPSSVTTAVVSSSSGNAGGDQSMAAGVSSALPHAAGLLSKSQSVIDEGHAGASSEDHAR